MWSTDPIYLQICIMNIHIYLCEKWSIRQLLILFMWYLCLSFTQAIIPCNTTELAWSLNENETVVVLWRYYLHTDDVWHYWTDGSPLPYYTLPVSKSTFDLYREVQYFPWKIANLHFQKSRTLLQLLHEHLFAFTSCIYDLRITFDYNVYVCRVSDANACLQTHTRFSAFNYVL